MIYLLEVFGWAIFFSIEDLVIFQVLFVGLSLALGLRRSERLGNFAYEFVGISTVKFLGLDDLRLQVIWVPWIEEIIVLFKGNLALL